MANKVLVVDDDIPLAKTLAQLLRNADYEPLLAHTAEDGLQLALAERPSLALLDVMVPHMGGWELCQRLREFSAMPIIFLTALGDVKDVVKGLEIGADDYLVKPVEPAEFLARVKVRLRRPATAVPPPAQFTLGDTTINMETRQVVRHNAQVELTPREFELLTVFVANADKVLTAAELAQQAWGMTDRGGIDNVKPYIHYLRKKIEADPASPQWIQTIRGVGYRFTSG